MLKQDYERNRDKNKDKEFSVYNFFKDKVSRYNLRRIDKKRYAF